MSKPFRSSVHCLRRELRTNEADEVNMAREFGCNKWAVVVEVLFGAVRNESRLALIEIDLEGMKENSESADCRLSQGKTV